MAAERTWLAWWRTALGASAGALGVGRLAPELLHVAAWPYVLLGCGYASLAVGLLLAGAHRPRALEHPSRAGGPLPLGGANRRGVPARGPGRPPPHRVD